MGNAVCSMLPGDQERRRLTATYRNHDLQLVAVGQHLHGMLAAGNDLPVALECHAFARHVQLVQQLQTRQGGVEAACFAIDGQLDQGKKRVRRETKFLQLAAGLATLASAWPGFA